MVLLLALLAREAAFPASSRAESMVNRSVSPPRWQGGGVKLMAEGESDRPMRVYLIVSAPITGCTLIGRCLLMFRRVGLHHTRYVQYVGGASIFWFSSRYVNPAQTNGESGVTIHVSCFVFFRRGVTSVLYNRDELSQSFSESTISVNLI